MDEILPRTRKGSDDVPIPYEFRLGGAICSDLFGSYNLGLPRHPRRQTREKTVLPPSLPPLSLFRVNLHDGNPVSEQQSPLGVLICA